MTYLHTKPDQAKIDAAIKALRAARDSKEPDIYPDLPEAPPIPVAEDDSLAIFIPGPAKKK